MARVHIYIPDELHEAIKRASQVENTNVSNYIQWACESYLHQETSNEKLIFARLEDFKKEIDSLKTKNETVWWINVQLILFLSLAYPEIGELFRAVDENEAKKNPNYAEKARNNKLKMQAGMVNLNAIMRNMMTQLAENKPDLFNRIDYIMNMEPEFMEG